MKKFSLLTLFAIATSIVSYNIYTNKIQEKKMTTINKSINKYADARLSLNRIETDVKNKIKFIKDNILNNNSYPNRKELESLIESINTIRSYGKDLTPKSKMDLKIIISNLKKRGKFQDLIKSLKVFVETSQSLIA